MRQIVEHGYAIPKAEIDRLTQELRKARADELANASPERRKEIEKEIHRAVQQKLKPFSRRWFPKWF
jgi:BMFP domain-containing protein YqiC